MRKRPPTLVIVIAVLQLVFGGFGLLCGVTGQVMKAAGFEGKGKNAAERQVQKEREEITQRYQKQMVPFHGAYTASNIAWSYIGSIVMVVSGIGLLLVHSWARWTAIVYAILSILHQIYVWIFNLVFLNPAMEAAMQEWPPHPDPERDAMEKQVMTAVLPMSIGLPLCCLVYPVAVLIVLFLPSVAAAFRAPPGRPRHDRDDDDDRWTDQEDEEEDDR